MKSNRKVKVVILILFLIEITSLFLTYKSFLNKEINKIKETHEVKNRTFSLFIENEEGNYSEYIESNLFPEGYRINLDKSKCVDTNGNEVKGILSGTGTNITVKSTTTSYCYLYFDLNNLLGDVIKEMSPTGLNVNLEGNLYRFQGTNPNNYICFGISNKEECISNTSLYMYRIIGINDNSQLKLIKKEALDKVYYWHNTKSIDITWPNSDIFKGLNGIDGGSYSNLFINNSDYDYMATNSEWYNKIADINWKFGDSTTDINISALELFNIENAWTETIIAKVGLIYAHDYAYAYQSGGLNCFSTGDYSTCKTSWMYISVSDPETPAQYEWTMSRTYDIYEGNYTTWNILNNGYMGGSAFNNTSVVRPVFFLESSLSYISGDGTITNPFIIS